MHPSVAPLVAGCSSFRLQLYPGHLHLAPHRRRRGAGRSSSWTVPGQDEVGPTLARAHPSGPHAAPVNATLSTSGSKLPTSARTQPQDLSALVLSNTPRNSHNYDASSIPVTCDMLLVTSWEESVDEQLVEEEDCLIDFQPGGGVSPSGISQGFATSKGPMKPTMQDYFVAVSDALAALWSLSPTDWRVSRGPTFGHHGGAPFCLTAVFDGHGGGDHAARTAQESVLAAVAADTELLDCFAYNMAEPGVSPEALAALSNAFRRAFDELDTRICNEGEARGLPHDGTTALVSVQVGPKLYTANAGDCRAVLSRDGRALRLSRDHKPELTEERQRIEAAGGRVANVRGTWRVVLPLPDGCTAKVCSVSRGFGDRDFKANSLISPEPDVAALVLAPHRDKFAVHASDGLWGAVGDQEAVDVVAEVIDKFTGMTSFNTQHAAAAKAAAQELVKLARDRGSMDDITCIVTLYDWD